jgi:hypothetical protein
MLSGSCDWAHSTEQKHVSIMFWVLCLLFVLRLWKETKIVCRCTRMYLCVRYRPIHGRL